MEHTGDRSHGRRLLGTWDRVVQHVPSAPKYSRGLDLSVLSRRYPWFGKGGVPAPLVRLVDVFKEGIQHQRVKLGAGDLDEDTMRMLIEVTDKKRDLLDREVA